MRTLHNTMRVIVILLLVISNQVHGYQKPRLFVNTLQQNYYNINVNHLPNFINDKQVESHLINQVGRKLSAQFDVDEIILPDFIEVKINGIYATRMARPSASIVNNRDLQASIISSISRDWSSVQRIWTVDIQVLSPSGIVFSNRIEQILMPYSVTPYLTQMRWLDKQEFASTFLLLVDKTLENNTLKNKSIRLGSDQLINNVVEKEIPGFKTHILTLNGPLLKSQKASLALDTDEQRLIGLNLINSRWKLPSDFDLDDKSKKILEEIMVELPEGSIKRGSIRKGVFSVWQSHELKVLHSQISIKTDEGYKTAPDFVGLFNKENEPKGRFYYFKQETREYDQIKRNRDPNAFGWGENHYLQGELNGSFYIIEFNELTGTVTFKDEYATEAILVLHNINPASRSFAGIMMNKGKKKILFRAKRNRDIDATDAEWYALFSQAQASQQSLRDYTQLFTLLFFAISAN
ncbi:MAG TPA: hypothetical protein PKC24_00380 [Cyclobacteriaceae bacterium]|nr:hypothetical protein [Cyclobacteriaceae bacterium]